MRNNLDSRVIEMLRLPLTALIVLLHVQIPGLTSGAGWAYLLKTILSDGICRIATPMFFIISGYLFFSNLEEWNTDVWLGKIKRRVHTLFIPYLFWNLLGIAYICISPYVGAAVENPGSFISVLQERGWLRLFWDSNRVMEQWIPPEVNILGYAMHSGKPANTPLWFIRDLFIMNLLAPIIFQFVKKTKLYGISILGVLFILNIWLPIEGLSIIGVFFYSIGAYLSISSKGLMDSFWKLKKVSIIGAGVLLALLVASIYRNWPFLYCQRIFRVFGSVAAFNIATYILRNKERVKTKFADSSFFIYASHSLVLPVTVLLLSRVLQSTSQIPLTIKYLLSAIITVTVCECMFQIMKKWFPDLLSFTCGNRRRINK